MPSGSDGGRRALAGFLYQLVGTAAVTARALCPVEISDDNGLDEVDALVSLTDGNGGFQALHEELGQDAVFTTGDVFVIAQFKYSSTARRIDSTELQGIVDRLDSAAERATSEERNVTACVLVTNRELTFIGGGARQLWEHEQERSRDYQLRHWSVSLEQLEGNLQALGAAHGLFPSEIESGVNNLIGRVLHETVGSLGASIGGEDIIESFTGCPEAKPLTLAAVATECRLELQKLGRPAAVERWDDMPIEREVFADIVDAINERALVGIYGGGGCGKSVILWQLLKQLVDDEKGFCMVTAARSLPDCWVTNTVHGWRNLPVHRRPTDDPEMAIQRLQLANPGVSKHILWLGLDGLDERLNADQIDSARRLVDWFWNKDAECQRSGARPSATLVTTCRHSEDLERYWLDLAPDAGEHPCVMEVGDFSARERREAARATFPELYQRLASIEGDASITEYAFYSSAVYADVQPYPRGGALDDTVLESLRHPVMWRALLSIGEADRLRAVQGNPVAVHLLARKFVEFLYWKLTLREPTFQHIEERRFLEVLRSVAVQTRRRADHSRAVDWTRAACRDDYLSGERAEALYEESLSAGLIVEHADGSWRWRHLIVREYLVNTSGAGYTDD